MDQHICLFYLADKLPVPKLQEFYHRMCSALNYSDRKYDSYYLLYDNQYHVFQDTPLTESRKKALKKIAPCSNCHAVCKKNIYKQYQIENNACIVCKLSPLYRNGRIQAEANVLRRFLEPNAPFSDVFLNPSMAFSSCVRLGRDYAIGTFPILQLNAFIYSYLNDHNGYGNETKESFLDSFVLFLLSKVTNSSTAEVHIDAAEFKDLIAFQLSRLYVIDIRSISSDLWEHDVEQIKGMYTYVAPSPAYKGTSVSVEPKSSKETIHAKMEGTQYSLLDVIAAATQDPNGSNQQKSEPDMYDESTYPSGDSVSSNAISSDFSSDGESFSPDLSDSENSASGTDENHIFDSFDMPEVPENLLYYEDQMPNEMSDPEETDYYPDEDIPAEAFQTYDGFVPPELLYDDAPDDVTQSQQDEVVPAATDNIVHYTEPDSASKEEPRLLPARIPTALDACVVVSDSLYESAVHPLTSEKCFSFSEHVLRSSFVCIEPAICFNRYGLLVFVPDNMLTYFFDLDLYGTDMLESLFAEDSLDVYTLHTLSVIDLFSRHHSSFHKVCPLDLFLADKYKVYDYSALYEKLSLDGTKSYTYMPSYPTLLERIEKQGEETLRDTRRIMLLYQVLANNDDLHFLNDALHQNLVVHNMHTVGFKYRFGMEIHQKGFMYIFELPKDSLSCVIESEGLFADVLLILNALPHLHKKKSLLLSMESSKLIFFYLGDKDGASQFYDLFLARLQNAFLKRYKKPLQSNSYCYIFDKH